MLEVLLFIGGGFFVLYWLLSAFVALCEWLESW